MADGGHAGDRAAFDSTARDRAASMAPFRQSCCLAGSPDRAACGSRPGGVGRHPGVGSSPLAGEVWLGRGPASGYRRPGRVRK